MATLNSWSLATLADLKESLGITTNTYDNLLIRKLNQATDTIERYCGLNTNQHFASTTYTDEEYDGTDSNQLVLKNRPIITFTSLSRRNTITNQSSWDTVNTQDYFVDSGAGVLDLLFTALGYWNYYKVTYTAGYATIPSDLAEACITLAGFLYDNASTGSGVKRKTQGPKTIEYFDASTGGNASIFDQLGLDDILMPYMRMPILADK